MICDRIKSTLPEGALNHVVRTEANLPEQWCRKDSLCDTLDTYYAVYDKFDKPKASALGAHLAPQQNRFQMGRGNGEKPNNFHPIQKPTELKPAMQALSTISNVGLQSFNRRSPNVANITCFQCGLKGHFRAQCKGTAQQSAFRKPDNPGARVFHCSIKNNNNDETVCKTLSRDVA